LRNIRKSLGVTPQGLQPYFRTSCRSKSTHYPAYLKTVPDRTQLRLEHQDLRQEATRFDLLLALETNWDSHLNALRNTIQPSIAACPLVSLSAKP